MSLWTFLAVIIVIGILADSYNKKLKYEKKSSSNQKELDELNQHIGKLEKRIENLEIIAVAEPDNFNDRTGMQADEETAPRERNRKLVNDLARKKAGRY